ncbi:hypothetical protein K1719_022804 [Acacia pycnantha]|nr:hypothetical protein K1719_022804 [Acacia pycnantha]
MSYRETLLQNENSRVCWWEWSKHEEEDEVEDYGVGTDFSNVLNPNDGIAVDLSNPLCPKFVFEEKERDRLMRPFRRTLIVKLLGRQPSYGFMVKKLRQIWERKGNIDIFDLENNFYLVNFQYLDDYMDAYLNVARWRPDFYPKNTRIESVVAWVCLPDLPAPLFDKKFLLNLGNVIGKAIRLDIHTAQRARGKFTRMCVELDLTKPLIPEFNVEGQNLSVVYESLGMLCTKCGWFGHSRDGCAEFHRKNNGERMEVEGPESIHEEKKSNEGEKELWKTIQRTRYQRRVPVPVLPMKTGSRFSVLDKVRGEEEKYESVERGQAEGSRKVAMERVQQESGTNQLRKKRGVGSLGAQDRVSRVPLVKKKELPPRAEKKEISLKKRSPGVESTEGKVNICVQDKYNNLCYGDNVKASMVDLRNRKGVDKAGKENLQPGVCKERIGGEVAMDTKDVQNVIEEEDPIGSYDMAAEGVSVDPGIGTKRGATVLKDMKFRYRLDVVVILEPRVSVVKTIPRVNSDHHPLIVNLTERNKEFRNRPFRYEGAWQLHEKFEDMIMQNWKKEEKAHVSLGHLKQELIKWNREVFGNIEYRKRGI